MPSGAAGRVILRDGSSRALVEWNGKRFADLPIVTVPAGEDPFPALRKLSEDAVALQAGAAQAWARLEHVEHAEFFIYREKQTASGAYERVRVRVKEIRERRSNADAGFFARLLKRGPENH